MKSLILFLFVISTTVSNVVAKDAFLLQNCDPDTIAINASYPGGIYTPGLYSCTTIDGQLCSQQGDQISCAPSFDPYQGCQTVPHCRGMSTPCGSGCCGGG